MPGVDTDSRVGDSTESSGINYADELAKAQDVKEVLDSDHDEATSIKVPEGAPEAVEAQARVATSLVELVKENAGQEAAARVAKTANGALSEGGASGSVSKESLSYAERIVKAMGEAVTKPKGKAEDGKPVEGDVGIGGITITSSEGGFQDLEDALGLVRRLDGSPADTGSEFRKMRTNEPSGTYEPQMGTFTLDTGALDTAVVVQGRREDRDGRAVYVYDVGVISTIDQGDRQMQQRQAASENGRSEDYVDGTRRQFDPGTKTPREQAADTGDFMPLPEPEAKTGRVEGARSKIRNLFPGKKSAEQQSDDPADKLW